MSVVDTRHSVQGWIAGARAALVRDHAIARGDMATFDVVDLLAVPEAAWADLVTRAVEANAFYHPAWARAVARFAEGKAGARALVAWDSPAKHRLIGLLPVVSAWRALRIPVPVFVAWQAYAPLTTPLLDRANPDAAARALIAAAAKGGAQALLMPAFALDGPAASAMRSAVAAFGPEPYVIDSHERAHLDAAQHVDEAVQALGSKKLKELRRQRNRLADDGGVAFGIAASGAETEAAIASFLTLEASGWKGAGGTALASRAGDAAFLKRALPAMVASGHAEVVTLRSGDKTVAAGILLRHLRKAWFFKIAHDPSVAKMSPGVQLTLDITRAMCADEGIDTVDSTAVANHPMIDHIWRDRQPVADMLYPVQAGKPGFALLTALINTRRALRGAARSLYHRLRKLKG